ncbi:hypothetical protein AAG906_023863 [Vitis piasezkii]
MMIFSLRFGSRLLVIISSPCTVEECFTKNDIIFANRRIFLFGKYIGYNNTIVTSAPYGEHWRNLRRLSALEIFSPNHLNMFIGTRRDEIKILLHRLLMFTELTCNIIMRMVAGKRYYGEDVDFEEAKHFHEEKKLVKIKTKKEVIFRGLIDEHRSPSRALVNKNSMINHLLSMQKSEPEYYTDEIIKGHSLVTSVLQAN